MSEGVALSREEEEMKTPRWRNPSLVPPVLSLASSGLLSGGGLLSEVLSLAFSALLYRVVSCFFATLLGVKDKVVGDIKAGMGQ